MPTDLTALLIDLLLAAIPHKPFRKLIAQILNHTMAILIVIRLEIAFVINFRLT
jgi:hypothetical protein